MALDPLHSCAGDETPCTPPGEVQSGAAILVQHSSTGCTKALASEDGGIPLQVGNKVDLRDGSEGKPIKLPRMRVLGSASSFPYLVVANKAGEIMRLEATPDVIRQYLRGGSGSFQMSQFSPEVCWNKDDICECTADYVTGWQEIDNEDGTFSLCLVRINLDDLVNEQSNEWANTNSAHVDGAGTVEDPRTVTVQLSNDENNFLEIREDGLYVTLDLEELGLGNAVSITNTESFIISLTDSRKFILCDSTAADIDVTIPPFVDAAFPQDTEITFVRYGVNDVTFLPGAGVTILSKDSLTQVNGQYAAVTIKKIAENTWLLMGSLQ